MPNSKDLRGKATANWTDDELVALAAPVYDVYYPEALWSEILPGLTLGGTDRSEDLVHGGSSAFGIQNTMITQENFDTVITLYAWARPVDWFVKEIRFGILDSDMSDFDMNEIHKLVLAAHTDWKAGKRVLIRCQAGINRSSLITALVLIRDGYSAKKAIDLLREKRGGAVLANPNFHDWLMQVDVRKWRA
ncbi:MAG: dual specificity protein phosphatase family protein [Micrococcales bacterium]